MRHTHICTEPICENVPDSMKYIFIDKEYPKPTPPDGKKKCNKEQILKYNQVLAMRKKMFQMLESGHYDIGNGSVRLESFIDQLRDIADEDICYIYKINPINTRTEIQHNGTVHYFVSKFDVEKKINSIYELIDDLSQTLSYKDLFAYIFEQGYYAQEEKKKYYIGLFEYAKEKYPEQMIKLGDCARRVRCKTSYMESYAKELLNNSLIALYDEQDDIWSVVGSLIGANWFEIARDYILQIPEDTREILSLDIAYDEKIRNTLKQNNDGGIVKEILNLLSIEDESITLTIRYEDGDSYFSLAETKRFSNLNEASTYIIRNHGVSFEDVVQYGIEHCRGENDESFLIS